MKKRVVFLVERTPWSDDQAYHFVRMALSLAADAEPVLIFAGVGSIIRNLTDAPPDGFPDIAGQLRLFNEMVGPVYWTTWDSRDARENVAGDALVYMPPDKVSEVIRNGHSLIHC